MGADDICKIIDGDLQLLPIRVERLGLGETLKEQI